MHKAFCFRARSCQQFNTENAEKILPRQPSYLRLVLMQGVLENINPDKLMTDRSTYITYLESQLERVTNACLTVESFDERMETAVSYSRRVEEKVMNVFYTPSSALDQV